MPDEPDPAAAPDHVAEKHTPEGLELARTTARSVAGAARAVRRQRRARATPIPPQSSGAHPDDRDPQPLARAVDRLVESRGWSTEVNVHSVLGRWPALVGPVNAQHLEPTGYADGVLTVQADSTAWAVTLRSMAPQVVARLNEALGQGSVQRIAVLAPAAPSWKRGRRSVRDGRGPRDTYG